MSRASIRAVATAGAVVAVAACAVLITANSPVDRSVSDPRYSLLVAQQLVDHGTVTLDEYDTDPPIEDRFVLRRDGHTHYYFPLGSSVLAAPAVMVAGWFGLDMAVQEDEMRLQNLLSSAVVGAVVALAFLLARTFTGRVAALVIAAVSVFGSALVSTLGTAFWNLDLAVLIEMVALVLVVRADRSDGLSTGSAVAVGVCLLAAFAVRPTTVPFILAVLAYLFVRERRTAIVASGTALAGLLVWTAMLQLATGVPTQDYYTFRRVTVARPFSFLDALRGHLASPSRGLFVFSPFLLAVVAASVASARRLRREPLAWVAVGWIAGHLLIASRATRWWGGPAFGPRILADALPAWILLTALAWHALAEDRQRLAAALAALYVALAVPAVAINTHAGLYRPASVLWNGPLPPQVDTEPQLVFDWDDPQWAASIDSLCRRNREYMAIEVDEQGPGLEPVSLGEAVGVSSDALWVGWARPGTVTRRTACREAGVAFRLADDSTAAVEGGVLSIEASSNGTQPVEVEINGSPVGSTLFTGPMRRASVSVPPGLLRPGAVNHITLTMPGAATRDRGDARLFGLRLMDLTLSPP